MSTSQVPGENYPPTSEQGYDLEKIKQENAALRKYAAIQKATEDKIGVQKIYIDITGDIEAAFVLDEIIFFTLPRKGGPSGLRIWRDGVLWMAVQRAEWWDRKRLTPRQADTAIQKLERQNLVVREVHRFNGQSAVHLRLNVKVFFSRYAEELEKENPPEGQDDTITKDLEDLYEMMGIKHSELQNGDSQNRESPKCHGELQNGDSINNPHQPSINEEEEGKPVNPDKVAEKAIEKKITVLRGLYEDNIGMVTTLLMGMFRNAALTYPEEWYQPAFEAMLKSAKHRSWAFVEAVLDGWRIHGFGWKPERANGSNKKRAAKTTTPDPVQLPPDELEKLRARARRELMGVE